MSEKIRLFVDAKLGQGQRVPLSRDQAHYLFGVMRQTADAAVSIFNGRDGEWRAVVTQAGKRKGELQCVDQTAPLRLPPDLWLLFAPIKKTRTDFIVEKAVEMGAAQIVPVLTDQTNAERVRQDRLQAHAVEAAEQCGGTFVPQVMQAQKLGALLDGWDPVRRIMFCDEAQVGQGPNMPARSGPWAILIGPEGGFSVAERQRLSTMDCAHPVSLGPRVLRADTAAVAALTVWQLALGDWR